MASTETDKMLIAEIQLIPAKSGLWAASIKAGPQKTTLFGYLSESLARKSAEHCAISVFGRTPRFV